MAPSSRNTGKSAGPASATASQRTAASLRSRRTAAIKSYAGAVPEAPSRKRKCGSDDNADDGGSSKRPKGGRAPSDSESDDQTDESGEDDSSDEEEESKEDRLKRYLSGDWELDEVEVLAETTATFDCTYGPVKADRADAWLTCILQVSRDHDTTSRLAYKASFFLTTDLRLTEDGKDPGEDPPYESVGLINAFHVDKKTRTHPNAKGQWIKELLKPDLWEEYEYDLIEGDTLPIVEHPAWRDTALCLQSLFTKAGKVRAKISALKEQLSNDGVMYIDYVYVNEDHQDRGLMKPMLSSFRSLLTQLPGDYAFEDTLVLVPGPPGRETAAYERYKDMDEVDVFQKLTKGYESAGFVIVAPDEWMGPKMTGQALQVMGRSVRDA